ncbi:hypothetical protein [Chryseobacterium sp. JJR-5R]
MGFIMSLFIISLAFTLYMRNTRHRQKSASSSPPLWVV